MAGKRNLIAADRVAPHIMAELVAVDGVFAILVAVN
jgi:hypothetical protein